MTETAWSKYFLFGCAILASVWHRATPRDEFTQEGWLYKTELGLSAIPPIPASAVVAYLNNNNITEVTVGSLNHLDALTLLSLSWNQINRLHPGAFMGLVALKDLVIFQNELTQLEPDTFRGLTGLENLVLSNNRIHTIPRSALKGLTNLRKLYLYQNNLQTLRASMFAELTSLDELTLTFNKITVMESGCFQGLGNLEKLWLDNNNVLKDLRKHMFVGLTKITRLAIHTNNIADIGEVFTDLETLEEIDLDDNVIERITDKSFRGLDKLNKVWLYNNRLTTLESNVFTNLPRKLDITIGGNPLNCDETLCWMKQGEKEGWLRWIPFEDRPLEPNCTSGVPWNNLTCSRVSGCPEPGGIPHGFRGESHWPYQPGSRVFYNCDSCYKGGGGITCGSNGAWTQKPSCEPITCPDPGDIPNASRVPFTGSLRCGQHVTYLCNHGYVMLGEATLECRRNGRYALDKPTCLDESAITVGATKSEQSSALSGTTLYVVVGAASLVFIVIIVIVVFFIVRRRRRRHERRSGPAPGVPLEASFHAGGVGLGAVAQEGGGYVNKGAEEETEAAGGFDTDEAGYTKLREAQDGTLAPPPDYETPTPVSPPAYTRHPSQTETSTNYY